MLRRQVGSTDEGLLANVRAAIRLCGETRYRQKVALNFTRCNFPDGSHFGVESTVLPHDLPDLLGLDFKLPKGYPVEPWKFIL
jgi:hypothetical protein